jgi:hypothetical protein
MEKSGLSIDMTVAVINIARGRLGLIADGQEHEGRLIFESGIRQARKVISEAMTSGDPELMLLAEYTYMSQTLEYATENDTVGRSRAQAAIDSFEDAFLSLQALADTAAYQAVEKAFPHRGQWRYKGLPRDAFHVAMLAHKTRITNSISMIGVNPLDVGLAETRHAAVSTAQNVYWKKQQTVLPTTVTALLQ